jgi:hypothetical protein
MTPLCVYDKFCLILCALRSEKSGERPSKGVEGIERAFALVGPGGAGQLQSALRGMLSWHLFESLNGAQSRGTNAANGQKGITPPPVALDSCLLFTRSRLSNFEPRITRVHPHTLES